MPYSLPPFTPTAIARIKVRRTASRGPATGFVTYTFAQPTGKRGRPRHVSFAGIDKAATVLGISLSSATQLAYGVSKRARNGVTFVRKEGTPRAVNQPMVGGRGAGKLPVRLQHAETGRIISASSIVAFCRRAKLGTNHRFHITPVLMGQRISHMGWALPKVLRQRLKLHDVYGNLYEARVGDMIGKVGAIRLNHWRRGKAKCGVAPVSHSFGPIVPLSPTRVTRYRFKHKGKTFTTRTQIEAAQRVGVSPNPIFSVVHGFSERTANGLTFLGAITEQRRVLELA